MVRICNAADTALISSPDDTAQISSPVIEKFHKFREIIIAEGRIMTHPMGMWFLDLTCTAAFLLASGDWASVFLQPYHRERCVQ